MKKIPPNVKPYKKTPEFDEQSIPRGFLKDHSTKDGVWGHIVLLEGQLEYTINEPTEETNILEPGLNGVVEPKIFHRIKALGKVKFYLEFYK